MEPVKINLWLVGEFAALVCCVAATITSFVWGQMTLPVASVLFVGFAILCSVESEQRNVD